MAGLFGLFDYNKPGNGIEKEDIQKNRFFVFFGVLSRKFFKFVQLNLIYFLFALPYILLLFWISPINTTMLMDVTAMGIGDFVRGMPLSDQLRFDALLRVMFAMGIVTFWGAGPASAGHAYVMRNFAREEHAWVWSDFWDNMKQNFKSGLIALIIDMAVICLSVMVMNFYSAQYVLSKNPIFLIIQGFLAVALILYTFMHYYIYQLMVTFDDRSSRLYRNSFVFAIAKFPQNLFFSIITIAIFIGAFLVFELYTVFLCIFILVTLCSFIIAFYSSGAIRKAVRDQKKED